ncbi:C-X-C motif chemokine ligand 13 [Rhinolophus ferrumequinum]|uniref:C-X-C motif chemokine ligand 13 n=1 Tax=Rhinolophus ferrumequinum TaxID=59479 RepID=A0A7J7ZBZ6_RHIFE|nr:C-X-C motif chemokine ligand 13 [Rhinolophus ferrumequinum]
MRFILASLLLILLVSSLCPVHGILEINNTNLKCQCKQTSSSYIRPRLISTIHIRPRGNGCPNKEIILTLKNKSTICVDPSSDWAKRVIKLGRKRKSSF